MSQRALRSLVDVKMAEMALTAKLKYILDRKAKIEDEEGEIRTELQRVSNQMWRLMQLEGAQVGSTGKDTTMKTKIAMTVIFVVALASMSHAWEFSKNPDRFPSFGIEVAGGKLPGIQKDVAAGAPHTDGGFVQGHLDIRMPISSNITVNLFGENTGVNNNLQFSEGHRVGAGVRVYIQ